MSLFILLNFNILTEAVVKYMDYLDANHEHVASYQESAEAKYTIHRERDACKMKQEHLEQKDFYDPIFIKECFTENQQLWYNFINHLKQNGIFIKDSLSRPTLCGGLKGTIFCLKRR